MGCKPTLPFPPIPDISPITLAPPALPALDIDAEFCCKLLLISITPNIPLGPAILAIPGAAAVVAGLTAIKVAVQSVLDALPLECPKE